MTPLVATWQVANANNDVFGFVLEMRMIMTKVITVQQPSVFERLK